jgi:outer membrane protein TolC
MAYFCTVKNNYESESMNHELKIWLAIIVLMNTAVARAANTLTLTLDSCKNYALRNNKDLRMAKMREVTAYHNRKSAFTNFLPKVSAAGEYLLTSDELSLLSDEQKKTLNATTLPVIGTGAPLVDALRSDTRNVTVGTILLSQPIYMGGKIIAYNNITKYAEHLSQVQVTQKEEDVIAEVEEAYWQIVSLHSKKLLAESYKRLVDTLDNNVTRMVEEGMATRADLLSVKVKVNEAKVAIIKVNNGLKISRMLLCQLCGLPLDTDIRLREENQSELPYTSSIAPNVQTAIENRPELKELELATKIYKEKVKTVRADFLPNVGLAGGYATSNPNMLNGFNSAFHGLWAVGITMKVPLLTWGDRFHKVKAAKNEVLISDMNSREAREKIELQVTQSGQQVEEARERLNQAHKSQDEADENLRHANLGLKEGVIPISNVIEAQTAWLSASSERVSAQTDLKIADMYLRKSMGILH